MSQIKIGAAHGAPPRCLISDFVGAVFSQERKDALWARFSMGAPRRQRLSVERKGARRSKPKPVDIWGGVDFDAGGGETTAPISPGDQPAGPGHAVAAPHNAIVPRRILVEREPALPAAHGKASGSGKRREEPARDDCREAAEIVVEPITIASTPPAQVSPPANVDTGEVRVDAPRSGKLRRREFSPGERW